jgi:hypothetical protein
VACSWRSFVTTGESGLSAETTSSSIQIMAASAPNGNQLAEQSALHRRLSRLIQDQCMRGGKWLWCAINSCMYCSFFFNKSTKVELYRKPKLSHQSKYKLQIAVTKDSQLQ